jgi:hypothetical protein
MDGCPRKRVTLSRMTSQRGKLICRFLMRLIQV